MSDLLLIIGFLWDEFVPIFFALLKWAILGVVAHVVYYQVARLLKLGKWDLLLRGKPDSHRFWEGLGWCCLAGPLSFLLSLQPFWVRFWEWFETSEKLDRPLAFISRTLARIYNQEPPPEPVAPAIEDSNGMVNINLLAKKADF